MQNAKSSKGFKVYPRKPKFENNGSKKGLSKKLVISSSIPSANVTRIVTRQPIYKSRNDGSIDVKHKELFYAAAGNTSWASGTALKTWDINPANALLFPWLSRIATAYEKYKFKKFKVSYVPNVGTSTAGNIALAIDFDVSDNVPDSLLELMSYEGATQSQPFARSHMVYPSRQLNTFAKHLFVARQGSNSGEPRTSHMGKLLCAIDTTALTPGFLTVSYEINLMIPEGKTVPLIFDRFNSGIDPAVLSSRRYVNSPNPTYVPKPIVNYSPMLAVNYFTGNSDNRYSTLVSSSEYQWGLMTVSCTGTGLSALSNVGLSNSIGLDFRYGSQVRSAADATYWVYFKIKDSYLNSTLLSWLRLDLFDVTTTLLTVVISYQAVSAGQAAVGMPDLHGALTAYSTPT